MVDKGLSRTEDSFKKIEAKYYNEKEVVNFNHLNSDHMAVLLYFAANSGYQLGYEKNLLEKFYFLNKIMNSIDMFYSINLPEVFCVVHPLGTVLGNAKYGNFMCIYQSVTVGSTQGNAYPEFGDRVVLSSNSSILGHCKIGNNVIFAANSFILNKDIPDNSIVMGHHPNNRIISIDKKDDVGIKVEIIFKNQT
jgi:serine O-acetyltransferase